MSKFVLTAQLKLQAPRNTRQVLNQMRSDLSGLSVDVSVKGAPRAQQQIKQVAAATRDATTAAHNMGKTFGVALKRFAAFTIASRAVSLFTNNLAGAIQHSIDFQREIIKIAQVTGKTTRELKGLSDEITHLSTTLGTSSEDLVKVTRILAQAGIQAGDLKVALTALAKTTLAPTFEDIHKTAEGAVAILSQFGQGVASLERQLGAINAVAGQFAVEAGDLIGAVRRFGGVFKAAGGNLEELIALFTSVRATTRESSESIATGLRTIFTRIQRPSTIAYLKEIGVNLVGMDGKFVGAYEAVRRLSKELGSLQPGDLRFIEIAEQLGGFRQIGKVIPLLQQFETAERARQAAIAGGDSLTKDAATAQQALAVQIVRVKEEFLALVRGVTESTSFQVMAKTALNLASALIQVADALRPILPMLGAFAAFKIAKGIGGFAGGIGASVRGMQGKHAGGQIHKFASGGFVPGTGNRDTVPAMLQPGEFVIRQSSAKKIGGQQLAAMNSNRYAEGGLVIQRTKDTEFAGLFARPKGKDIKGGKPISMTPKKGTQMKEGQKEVLAITGAPSSYFISGVDEDAFVTKAQSVLSRGIHEIVRGLKIDDGTANRAHDNILNDIDPRGIAGDIFEGVTKTAIGDFRPPVDVKTRAQAPFDIRRNLDAEKLRTLSQLFGYSGEKGLPDIDYDNKLSETDGARRSLLNKASNAGLLHPSTLLTKFASIQTTAQLLAQKKGDVRNNALFKRRAELRGARDRLSSPSFGLDKPTQEVVKGQLERELRKISASGGLRADFVPRAKKVRKAAGGSISGSDTVPALLTPGEFVVNKSSAQSIGYGKLNQMNKKGVTGFAAGGPVGVQRFAAGGAVGGGGMGDGMMKMAMVLPMVTGIISQFGDKSKEASEAQFMTAVAAERLTAGVTQLMVGFMLLNGFTKMVQRWGGVIDEAGNKTKEAGSDIKAAGDKALSGGKGKKGKGGGGGTAGTAEKQENFEARKTKAMRGQVGKKGDVVSEAKGERGKVRDDLRKNKLKQQAIQNRAGKTMDVEAAQGKEATKQGNISRRAAWKAGESRTNQGQLAKEGAEKQTRLNKTKGVEVLAADKAKDKNRIARNAAGAKADVAEKHKQVVNDEAANRTEAQGKIGKSTQDAAKIQEKITTNKKRQENVAAQGARAKRDPTGMSGDPASSAATLKKLKAEEQNLKAARVGSLKTVVRQRKAVRASNKAVNRSALAVLKTKAASEKATKESQRAGRVHTKVAGAVKRGEASVKAYKDAILKQGEQTAKQMAISAKAHARELKAKFAASAATDKVSRLVAQRNQLRGKTAGLLTKEQAASQKILKAQQKLSRAKFASAAQSAKQEAAIRKKMGIEQKETGVIKKSVSWLKKLRSATATSSKGHAELTRFLNKEAGASKRLGKTTKNTAGSARQAEGAIKRMNAQMKKTRGGGKGGFRRGVGKVAGAGRGMMGVMMSASMLAQQFAAAGKQIADRRLNMAKDKGDVGGAVKAAKAGALSEGLGEAFSLTGVIGMLTDFEGFYAGMMRKKENAEADAATSVVDVKQQKILEDIKSGKAGDSDFIDAKGQLDIAEFGKAGFGASKAAMDEIKDASPEKQKEHKARLKKNEAQMAIAMGKGAKTMHELEASIQSLNQSGIATAKEELLKMAKSAFMVEAANRAVAKANVDNLKVMSAFAASSGAVNSFLSSLETGSLSLGNTISTMEAAQSNMGMGAEGTAALKEAEKAVLKSVGGPDSSTGKATVRSFERAQGVNDFMGSLQGKLGGLDLRSGDKNAATNDLESALLKGVKDKDIRTAISAKVQSMGDVRGKDLTSIIDEIKSSLEPLSKTALASARALLQHQTVILNLTKERRKSELAFIAAQKQAIDIQLNAAKIFESFGGAKLTTEKKEEARVAQFNLVAKDAGIGPLKDASAASLAKAREEVQAKAVLQKAQGAAGGFGGVEGVDKDRTKELSATNKALMELTKQRISQIREEISIIDKKNAAEKSSFEKLMSGDIEGFIDAQAAAGASAALRAGDASLASLFGPGALSAGMKGLEGTGMSPAEMERAQSISLSTVGITGTRAAQVAAGTGPEKAALEAEGRGLAGELGAQGQQMGDLAKMDVNTAEMKITNATVIFSGRMKTAVEQQNAFDQRAPEGLAGGGLIYANRGIFVPRGTDTVPAMLTPGEFVVNRAAVNRGNNLQLLRAMNSTGRDSAPAPAAGGMQAGGQVGYYQFGDLVKGMSSMTESLPALSTAIASFSSAIEKLTGFSMGVDIKSIPPISVNVIMPMIEPAIRDMVLDAVRDEIPKHKATSNGLQRSDSSMP